MSQVRTRAPKHQNEFAFRHNPKSKKTAKILALPNEGLCKRCHDKVEWRKKYRKYKPLTVPSSCNTCRQKTVRAAYHTICQPCSQEKGVCAGCGEKRAIFSSSDGATRIAEERAALEKQLEGLHLRKKRTMLRQFDKSNGLVKPSEEDIAKAAIGDSDDEGLSDFDDDDLGDDFEGEHDADWSEEDPLERALAKAQADAAKGGLGLLGEADGKGKTAALKGPAEEEEDEEEEEEEEEDEDEDEKSEEDA